nr:PREDICTED: uncharacterized protein LOC105664126 [Megachile rotundata]
MKEIVRKKKKKSWDEFVAGIKDGGKVGDMWRKVKIIAKGLGEDSSRAGVISRKDQIELEREEIRKLIEKGFYDRVSGEEVEVIGENVDHEREGQVVEGGSWNWFDRDIEREELDWTISRSRVGSAPGKDGIEYKPQRRALRPISLLDCLGKVLEKITNERLRVWAEEEDRLDRNQSGFSKGTSTWDNLVILTSYIRENFGLRREVICAFIDVREAYDSFNHGKLVIGLRELGCPVIRELKVKILEYADDIAVYLEYVHREEGVRRLEEALKRLREHLAELDLEIAPEKTQILTFSGRKGSISSLGNRISLGDVDVEEVGQARFLGVVFYKNLLFREHAKYVVERVRKSMNILKCIGGVSKGADPETTLRVFKAIVRYTDRLQKIHNAGIRVALGYRLSTPIKMMKAGVMNLEVRLGMLAVLYMVRKGFIEDGKVIQAIEGRIRNGRSGEANQEVDLVKEGWALGGEERGILEMGVIHKIRRGIKKRNFEASEEGGGRVGLAWTPTHVGITGNERADRVAKEYTVGEPEFWRLYERVNVNRAAASTAPSVLLLLKLKKHVTSSIRGE